ncbi:type II toxin-antitoxin system VapB family antitoxin [uncultured Paracoccus sp.]|uniref:type II toxin-antitoxin system VapB family antitoxin n=1 Tax=uncultured Paracoccus sp. TaxID=189685 RepID=UPI00260728B8|nr:type II toxin-antitoxin system VapB family antitoxin [uncultured Paracoccus sp.]
MPLYVRDETVNDLAVKLAGLTGQNKTAAVKAALEDAIERQASQKTLAQRVAAIQGAARQRGLRPDGFDDKPLMDDLSGGL